MACKTETVPAFDTVDREQFLRDIYQKKEPAVLRGVDIGPCSHKWTTEYLAKQLGENPVKIHVCEHAQMDFINKNFAYKTLSFKEFIQRVPKTVQEEYFVSETEKYYLRSLGENPRKDIADIRKDFPAVSEDLHFPPFFDDTKFFSSVLKIASQGVQLWTHYDVMDNLLVVISGRKRVILYPPWEARYLYLNGDKSEVLDIDNVDLERFPEFSKATRHECILEPGEVLFIPAMWFHNVLNEKCGVAVNIFWRGLEDVYYDKNDTYGNKDLVPASRAMQVLDRALKILDELPDGYRELYAQRMISKLETRATNMKNS